MAMDVEFASEGRYIPELSLVQLAWGDPEAPALALMDFLALGESGMAPVFALIEDPDVVTYAHAARQDLGLLLTRFQVRANAFFDTQIAAAFAGQGDQIGYAKLVQRLLDVKLDKSSQFTDWLDRPLSDRQLRYAADDVRYLPRVWLELRDRLQALGRLAWVEEESIRLADSVTPPAKPAHAYTAVKGWKALRGSGLASLFALAAWRQREALDKNLPLSWILPDKAMIELCRGRARTTRALRSVRGVGQGTVRKYGEDILQALTEGARQPPPEVPPASKQPALSTRASLWASVVVSLVHALCLRADIVPRFVVNRSDAEILAAWFDTASDVTDEPDIPLLSGWRRQLAGDVALAWLRGRSAICADTDLTGLGVIDRPDHGK